MDKTTKLRLSPNEIETIRNVIKKYDPKARIFIFGSRIDPLKKGGDIDILVISKKIDYKMRRKIRVDLLLELGDRKIDIIIADNIGKSEFIKVAYKYGVEIWK